jgi:phage gp29-like protein
MAKKNPTSQVGAERARLFKLMYASPIKGLTPAKLVSWLDAFNRGELREAVLLWQQILDRDDQVGPCADKRTRAVARLSWEILPVDDSPAAAQHKEALEHFYNHLTAFDGLNEMERGGVRQLIKQMMSAVGMRYAMHEIIWQPSYAGGLTAHFKFLPLQFFENTTGRLRYLEADFAREGKDLDAFFGRGNWLCNCGEGLMFASSIAYLFKTPNGLKAWVSFMEKFGIPGVHASTSAAKDSAEWDALVEAVSGFGEDLALVTNEGAKITPLQVASSGQAPHAPLVDRMDRAISRIWMGGDLATMSAGLGQGQGASLQVDDLEMLKEDDAGMISDALNEYVDRQVIRQRFGDNAAPLAYFQLVVPKRKSTDDTVKRIETAVKHGVPVSQSYLRQELSIPEPKEDEELLTAPAPAAVPGFVPPAAAARAVNERARGVSQAFSLAALREAGAAQAATLKPLLDRIAAIQALPDEKIDAAIEALKRDLPQIRGDILRDPKLAAAFEKILGAALVDGATEGRAATQPASTS